jgi:hypothetical protein
MARTLVVVALALLVTTGAHAGSGASVVTIAIPADGQSVQAAVRVARLADEVWSRDEGIVLLDLERVLEGGEPPWVEKLMEARTSAHKGKQAMGSLELSVAADAYADAVVKLEQSVAGLADLTGLVDALVQQGAVYVLLGDARAARASFARALALDPAYSLSREGVSPRVVFAFETAMKDARGTGRGSLTVYSTTGAAEVWIDGVFRGISPFTVDINVGRHYVRVVRDGYVAFGTGVDVKRGSEASVQASLRPAARLAKLEELSLRVARDKEKITAVAELAAALQVDQLLAILVEDDNGSALLTATLVDGVSGRQLVRASRAFATGDAFFERDVRVFLDDKVRRAQGAAGGQPTAKAANVADMPDAAGSLLPGKADDVKTPPSVTGGWALVGIASALAVNAIVCGIVSFNLYDAYRNKLASQLDPKLEPVRSTWLTVSIVTDASWIVGAAAGAGGAALLVSGYGEMQAQEDVVGP